MKREHPFFFHSLSHCVLHIVKISTNNTEHLSEGPVWNTEWLEWTDRKWEENVPRSISQPAPAKETKHVVRQMASYLHWLFTGVLSLLYLPTTNPPPPPAFSSSHFIPTQTFLFRASEECSTGSAKNGQQNSAVILVISNASPSHTS